MKFYARSGFGARAGRPALLSWHVVLRLREKAAGRIAHSLLSLAAAPTFAAMALLTATAGSGDVLCSAANGSPLGGMAAMYLLMSAFHLVPWLKLISRRRSG